MPRPEDSVPKAPSGPRLRARDALLVVAVALGLLVLFKGSSMRDSGEEMQPGLERSVVLAVARPAGWIADQLPFAEVGDKAFGWISPDDDLEEGGGFTGSGASARETGGARRSPRTPSTRPRSGRRRSGHLRSRSCS